MLPQDLTLRPLFPLLEEGDRKGYGRGDSSVSLWNLHPVPLGCHSMFLAPFSKTLPLEMSLKDVTRVEVVQDLEQAIGIVKQRTTHQ